MCSFPVLQEQQPGGSQSFPKFRVDVFLLDTLFLFTFQKAYGLLCTSEVCRILPCNREGCWCSKLLFLRWRVMGFYQLRIDLCCALMPNCLASKLIVKMMLLILHFLKEHQLFAYYLSSRVHSHHR